MSVSKRAPLGDTERPAVSVTDMDPVIEENDNDRSINNNRNLTNIH